MTALTIFHLFPHLPRDIQLVIWDLYESGPGMRHKFTVGYGKLTHTTIDPSHNKYISNTAGENDPAELRLDPFCKYKFDKIELSNADDYPAPPNMDPEEKLEECELRRWYSARSKSWLVTQPTSNVYADLERDVFYLNRNYCPLLDSPQGGAEGDMFRDQPAACWMPKQLSQARHVAVPLFFGHSNVHHRDLWLTLGILGQYQNLKTVYIVVRPVANLPDRVELMRRVGELPRDVFGFVALNTFLQAFRERRNIDFIRRISYWQDSFMRRRPDLCQRARVIPVVDACFDASW
ncbi:hypothetical protein PFICI_00388 [Pestalotiopsis fici W106-1]|uniref:Uncharacterized protein n=1 Tax=Pestalotiopsis fici (strain W106-1 / CGMCC3.15140) TaxID=1229662 RepID=W3XKN0_PESFW|nr:uncharacterized protein PFICI_00388 [Pestalotiopsis fici W106-1]ETS86560.1 hypothetical protein PFICI_00388 [Pestalotiopsis fici W106-1]